MGGGDETTLWFSQRLSEFYFSVVGCISLDCFCRRLSGRESKTDANFIPWFVFSADELIREAQGVMLTPDLFIFLKRACSSAQEHIWRRFLRSDEG